MPLEIDWYNSLIMITSPTISVDGQVLHDFIEDKMASPEGMLYAAILQPEGKIEDPTNPGVYSQIIIVLNSPWQIQFWGGSGYTRIFGAKIVGGLSDEVLKATGTAGDITVLESPVDGLTVTSGSGVTAQDKTDIAALVADEDLSSHNIENSMATAVKAGTYRQGSVTLDTVNGTAGTGWAIGTGFKPSSNLTDALLIMFYGKVDELVLRSDVTVGATHDISNIVLRSMGKMGTDVLLVPGCTAEGASISNVSLSGTITAGDKLLVSDSQIGVLDNFQGIMNNVVFGQGAEVSLYGWAEITQGTAGGEPTNEVEINVGTASLNISHWTGNLKLIGKTGTNRIVVSCDTGNILIGSTCIAGTIQLLGEGQIEADNSGPGCTVDTDGFVSIQTMAAEVENRLSPEIERLLGLVQENYYLDTTVYDANHMLTSGRLRIYTAAGSVGTVNHVLATYFITSTWTGTELQTYKVVKQ